MQVLSEVKLVKPNQHQTMQTVSSEDLQETDIFHDNERANPQERYHNV